MPTRRLSASRSTDAAGRRGSKEHGVEHGCTAGSASMHAGREGLVQHHQLQRTRYSSGPGRELLVPVQRRLPRAQLRVSVYFSKHMCNIVERTEQENKELYMYMETEYDPVSRFTKQLLQQGAERVDEGGKERRHILPQKGQRGKMGTRRK